jgi:hypothetical protein
MTLSTATPNLLQDPGYLLIAPVGSTLPTNTVVGSVFTDAWDAAWLSLGATEDGSALSYNTTVQPVNVAEFFDPITYRTTDRAGSIAFNLASWTLTNYKRALNGGATALSPTSGSGTTALYTFNPPAVGSEVRVMIGWESLDHTVRLVAHQCLSGAQITSAFKKAPAVATIPCDFKMEIPSAGQPFTLWTAGSARG